MEIDAVKTGIFRQLGEKYPMLFDSKKVLHNSEIFTFSSLVTLALFVMTGISDTSDDCIIIV